ncbi:MAG: NUDIX hydrolase [Patescibacteria group bacterium]|nr:NUDIX hydrolase [Patescibacteria group bacterium]
MERESSGGIVRNRAGKIVLVRQHGNSWSFPKGGVEQGETLMDAARREIFEETGLENLKLLRDLGSYERYSIGKGGVGENTQWGKRRRHLFLFHTDVLALAPHDSGGEISEARFVSLEEAQTLLTHPKDREFLEGVRPIVEAL